MIKSNFAQIYTLLYQLSCAQESGGNFLFAIFFVKNSLIFNNLA